MQRVVPLAVVLFLTLFVSASAESTFPPAQPQFNRHVIPLFSRLGCNAGTCHGKVKGENGFRLSLFGVDPQQDHDSLLKEFAGRRVNLSNVDSSLLLLKPMGMVPHAGGKLLEPNGPEHEILKRWLEQGAKLDPPGQSRIVRMTVAPNQQTIERGQPQKLKVEVEFSDGAIEDVTPLCRFEPVNKDVVSVDLSGTISANTVGDSAVVVRYGAQPAVAMVVVPGTKIDFPQVAANNFIDDHVTDKLRTLNIPPAELCDDATFLRRVSLDICGSLPAPDEVRQFLADADPQKRQKKIDELLEATWLFGAVGDEVLRLAAAQRALTTTLPSSNRLRTGASINGSERRLEENLPYDELCRADSHRNQPRRAFVRSLD